KKDKKDKKETKTLTPEITPVPTTSEATLAPAVEKRWNDWSQADLGNEKQNDKFLRLLGAKKNNPDGSATATPAKKGGLFGSLGSLATTSSHTNTDSAIDSMVGRKVTRDLEKQFKDGLKIRQQMKKGKSVGLGFGY
ncbi:hypothetical protein FBU30_002440, partial [Linnemannia zychae]